MKQNASQARAPTDEVELPFCEGLEIISASQLQQTPAVLTEAAAPIQAAPPVREPHRPGPSDRYLLRHPPLQYHTDVQLAPKTSPLCHAQAILPFKSHMDTIRAASYFSLRLHQLCKTHSECTIPFKHAMLGRRWPQALSAVTTCQHELALLGGRSRQDAHIRTVCAASSDRFDAEALRPAG